MPFWPSLEPCAKLTPVQVSTNKPRIQPGGDFLPTGARKSSGRRMQALVVSSSSAEATNPMMGEIRSDNPTAYAEPQLTPSPKGSA